MSRRETAAQRKSELMSRPVMDEVLTALQQEIPSFARLFQSVNRIRTCRALTEGHHKTSRHCSSPVDHPVGVGNLLAGFRGSSTSIEYCENLVFTGDSGRYTKVVLWCQEVSCTVAVAVVVEVIEARSIMRPPLVTLGALLRVCATSAV